MQRRFGRPILELGGNNAIIVAPDFNDIDGLVQSVVFAAFGTQGKLLFSSSFFIIYNSGQRCTTLRRLFLPESIYDEVLQRVINGGKNLAGRIGDPMCQDTLYGPMHNQSGVDLYKRTVQRVKEAGGKIESGGNQIDRAGFFVDPCVVTGLSHDHELIQEEAFCPILYVMKYGSLDEAIEWNNEVEQGEFFLFNYY